MDETNFLAPWYEKNKSRGVEVIGLGYERSPDHKKAAERLIKMNERLNVGYDLAVAGISDKEAAGKVAAPDQQSTGLPHHHFPGQKRRRAEDSHRLLWPRHGQVLRGVRGRFQPDD